MAISREALDRLAVLQMKVEERTVEIYLPVRSVRLGSGDPSTGRISDPKWAAMLDVVRKPSSSYRGMYVTRASYWQEAPLGALKGAIEWAMQGFEPAYSDTYQEELREQAKRTVTCQTQWRFHTHPQNCPGGCMGTGHVPTPQDWDLASVNAAARVLKGDA